MSQHENSQIQDLVQKINSAWKPLSWDEPDWLEIQYHLPSATDNSPATVSAWRVEPRKRLHGPMGQAEMLCVLTDMLAAEQAYVSDNLINDVCCPYCSDSIPAADRA
jgi:hypothetical protein